MKEGLSPTDSKHTQEEEESMTTPKDAAPAGPWGAERPSPGCKSWNVARRNPKAVMGTEYLMGGKQPRRFRTRDAAEREAARLNTAIAKATGETA